MVQGRRHIPGDIELRVLNRSRRRCVLCFQLNGDLTEKHGQIAHIDKDPANYKEDNLAWLCLDDHSLFDSRTSQHKNYTQAEVKDARAALYLAIGQGNHSAQSIALPQGRNADRQTLAAIIGVIDKPALILLQHPNFAGDAYEYTRLDCLVSFLRNHSQPQHEFIDPEIEELRSAFRNNVIQFLAIAQALTEPLADDLSRFSLSTTLRHVYPDQYIYHATVLNNAATKTFESYQRLIRRARQRFEA